MGYLRKRRDAVIVPMKVAEEVMQPATPLKRFLDRYPDVITSFNLTEEDQYLEMRAQPGIDDGEAAAITLALSRGLPLIIDEKKGRSKAENHALRCLSWQDFVQGA